MINISDENLAAVVVSVGKVHVQMFQNALRAVMMQSF
jgi:hypothetical protein